MRVRRPRRSIPRTLFGGRGETQGAGKVRPAASKAVGLSGPVSRSSPVKLPSRMPGPLEVGVFPDVRSLDQELVQHRFVRGCSHRGGGSHGGGPWGDLARAVGRHIAPREPEHRRPLPDVFLDLLRRLGCAERLFPNFHRDSHGCCRGYHVRKAPGAPLRHGGRRGSSPRRSRRARGSGNRFSRLRSRAGSFLRAPEASRRLRAADPTPTGSSPRRFTGLFLGNFGFPCGARSLPAGTESRGPSISSHFFGRRCRSGRERSFRTAPEASRMEIPRFPCGHGRHSGGHGSDRSGALRLPRKQNGSEIAEGGPLGGERSLRWQREW